MLRLQLFFAASLAVLASPGCSDPSAAAAQTAGPAPTASVDLAKYCSRTCERATECGISALEQTVKANAADVAVLNKARSSRPATTATCEQSCGAEPSEGDRELLVEAEKCLGQTSCETFSSCLATVAKRDN